MSVDELHWCDKCGRSSMGLSCDWCKPEVQPKARVNEIHADDSKSDTRGEVKC